ncbi:hypothetical protein GS464_20220 [Rhodococcus hoagii]|nr:hypothetical protein [Prescottella equi]MBM4644788.1 hypothetical protein [Prescottella equi]
MASTPATVYARKSAEVAASKTVAAADSGVVQNVTKDAVVVTLPATAAGLTVTIRNGGKADGQVGFSISPNSADKIQGYGLTSADNKDVINTKATARAGDEITLVGDGVDGWFVQNATGVFDREA